MTWTRPAFLGLAWLFVLFTLLQFYVAGYALIDLGADGSDPERIRLHRALGYAVFHMIPVLMILAAAVGKLGKKYLIMSVVLLALVVIQPFFATPDIGDNAVRALHVLNGLIIAFLGFSIAHSFTRDARAEKA